MRGMLSSIPGLYPRDVSRTTPHVTTRNVPRHCQMSPGAKPSPALSGSAFLSSHGTECGYCTLRWRVPGPGRKNRKGEIPPQGYLIRSLVQQNLLHFIAQNCHVTTCFLKVAEKREVKMTGDGGWVTQPSVSATPAQSSPPTKIPATRYTWFSQPGS